jgi:RNA polymerase sigma-70 factor (ECF subfamily)
LVLTKEEFKNIYNTFFDSIRSYIYYRSSDAELATDIAQEVFLKVWEKQFNDYSNIKSLLYKMAGDTFISYYRKSKTSQSYIESFKLSFIEAHEEDSLELNEMKQAYEKALAKLSEKQRSVFLMSRMEELTYKEIADRLNISVKAVEKRMSQSLALIKKQLQPLTNY